MKTEDAHRELLAYELEAREARGTAPPRRSRSWKLVGAILAGALLVVVGVVIGALARNHVVDDQRRRVAGAEQQVLSLRQELAQRQNAIAEQQRQIARDREQLAHLRETLAQQRPRPPESPAGAQATSFDDGLYQVGVAIQPGQYHTGGSDSCYWAKLASGDTNRVIVNNIGAGPQTLTIDSPYFESEGCGTWTKVG